MSINKRLNWDDYFLNILDAISKRATCDRGKSACIIVRDNRILSTGYVGSPPGLKDCYENGHLIRQITYENGETKEHCMRTIHAEQNAIVNAARFGVALENSTLYSTMEPCYTCSMLIIATGIKRIVCKNKYHASQDSINILNEAGISLEVIENKIIEY